MALMQNFFIAGVSGIGKSHLELELARSYGFYLFPKYTDRIARPGEAEDGSVISVSKEEFSQMEADDSFMFRLDYVGNRYGWLHIDFATHQDQNITLQLPARYLEKFLEQAPDWKPILLDIDQQSIDLLIERMKQRHEYDKLSDSEKNRLDKEFKQRLGLILEDNLRNKEYRQIISDYNGRVFMIKDDQTLYQEVIPFILAQR